MRNLKFFPLINQHFRDLNPLDVGWEKCENGYSFGPFVRDYYLIHYVVSGTGVFRSPHGTFPVRKKQIFIIRPQEETTYTADEKDPWHYIWIGFNGTLASRLDSLPPVVSYDGNLFTEMLQCEEDFRQREFFLTSKLFELFSELFRISHSESTPKYECRAADYIRANYMRPLRIEEIAALIGINRPYLSRLFKSRYGVTMQQFLVRTRLQHAARFLQDGSSVAQAAYLCGYEDVFNFSKMFKKEYGASPLHYQKSAPNTK